MISESPLGALSPVGVAGGVSEGAISSADGKGLAAEAGRVGVGSTRIALELGIAVGRNAGTRGARGAAVGSGTGWITGGGVGSGIDVERGASPEGGRSKSPTGGVMIIGRWLFCAATGAERSSKGMSAAAVRKSTVTRAR